MRSLLLCAVVGVSVLGLSAAGADEAPATIRVRLPADAKLTIDGEATKSTSADRTFITPAIESGKDFHYTLRAEIVRDGETLTIERRIAVRAGQETSVSLNLPGASAENRSYYYGPTAPRTEMRFPVVRQTVEPDLSPLPADVGGARNNWKPDPSDPFYIPYGW